jgi:hypothetical protein
VGHIRADHWRYKHLRSCIVGNCLLGRNSVLTEWFDVDFRARGKRDGQQTQVELMRAAYCICLDEFERRSSMQRAKFFVVCERTRDE